MPAQAYEVEVCVVGGGPAGATVAHRLAALGHRVLLIEGAKSAAGRPGESLAPGILPVLHAAGVGQAVESAGFLRTTSALVRWADERAEPRTVGGPAGFLVDRERFDELLLAAAVRAGAELWRPAMAMRPRSDAESDADADADLRHAWLVPVRCEDGSLRTVRARFLVDATGKRGWLPGPRRRDASPLVALTAHFSSLPPSSSGARVEAQPEGWLWGAPLPDGSFSAMAFFDPQALPARGTWQAALLDRLARSELFRTCLAGSLLGPVRAHDASALHRDEPIGPAGENWLRVGDASFAIDPLSSQGVQAAMSSALHAAIVVHTILTSPAHAEAARRFYRERQTETVERHARWAAQLYAERHPSLTSPFWLSRATASPLPTLDDALSDPTPRLQLSLSDRLRLAPETSISLIPRIERDLVTLGHAVTHPRLPRPIAYLGGVELAPLLTSLTNPPPTAIPTTVGSWLSYWSPRLSAPTSRELLAWLLRARIVVAA